MPANQPADTLGNLAAQVLASDEQLKKEVAEAVKLAVRQAIFTLKFGTPQDKAAIMKAIVPSMLKSMQSLQDDEFEQQRRQAYERLRRQLVGEDGEAESVPGTG
jgi:hypothetical protein